MASFTQAAGLDQTVAANTGMTLSLPARNAGDILQFVIYAPNGIVNPPDFTKTLDLGGLYLFQKTSVSAGGSGGTFTIRSVGAGRVQAVAQAVSTVVNPNQPGGNEALRRALLGFQTGSASGLPFNSGVTPAGRSGSYAGYEGIQDQVEVARGVPFDVRCGFQYQNRNISEGSTAWNDLVGMQLPDWFDPTFPLVLGMKPFPTGGSYTDAKNGVYDAKLVQIGQTIAQKRPAGTGKIGLRLAWEMNGDWYDHSAFNSGFGSMRADYVAGSQRIISKIREGAGDRVFFIQCWSASTNTRYQQTYWGDAYADAISVDVYDAFAGTTNGIHTQAQLLATGLGGMFDFAVAHGKLVGIDEWGGHNTAAEPSNGNDNADFPVVFYDWVYANRDRILYEAQFNDTATGNVENNLWATGGTSVQLPNQRAAYIAKVQDLAG